MDTMSNIVDSNGVSYEILEKIGEGSQGLTFLLANKTHIAKIFKNIPNTTELKSKIQFLINLNLDKEIYAVPLREITAPQIGYISELASGMMPLTRLIKPKEGEDFSTWYIKTGGLFKRYGVLIKLARAIRTLHANGLIYCDLSPNNIYVSENKHNVFLIDMDNLRYKTSIIHNIYTPNYGAPEIVNNFAPNTMSSDCFSFAVIAYELLALNHPLKGDKVDEDAELEEEAFRGKLPWVEDSKDNSNARSTGFPSSFFIAESIQKLFHRTFEDGLNDPMKRPSIHEWVDALNDGLNELLKCDNCGTHYPYRNNHRCPFCEKAPEFPFSLTIKRWEIVEYYDASSNEIKTRPELIPDVLDELYIDEKTRKHIKGYHLLCSTKEYDTPIAEIAIEKIEGNVYFIIEPKNNFNIRALVSRKEYPIKVKSKISFKNKKEIIIGIEPFNQPQRVLVL